MATPISSSSAATSSSAAAPVADDVEISMSYTLKLSPPSVERAYWRQRHKDLVQHDLCASVAFALMALIMIRRFVDFEWRARASLYAALSTSFLWCTVQAFRLVQHRESYLKSRRVTVVLSRLVIIAVGCTSINCITEQGEWRLETG